MARQRGKSMKRLQLCMIMILAVVHSVELCAASSQPKSGKASAPKSLKWKDIPGSIHFYDRNKAYSELSNFFESPMVLDGKLWRTVEQYYQAQKFTQNPSIKEHIRRFNTDQYGSAARKAYRHARKMKKYIDSDWADRKISVMLKALRKKFSENPVLRNRLLETGNAVLVEVAGAHDAFYGDGANGSGRNHLGQLLMHVRDEIRTGERKQYQWHSPNYFAKL